MNKQGWYKQSYRHSLASRGFKTKGSHSISGLNRQEQKTVYKGLQDLPDTPYSSGRKYPSSLIYTKEYDIVPSNKTMDEIIEEDPTTKNWFEDMTMGIDRADVKLFDIYPKGEAREDSEDISYHNLPANLPVEKEGFVYRGMSDEEFENSRKRGYFQSDLRANEDIGVEGQETSGTTKPEIAANYAMSGGFTNTFQVATRKRTPKIVVFRKDNWETDPMIHEMVPDVKRPRLMTEEELTRDGFDSFKNRKGKIPTNEIVEVWEQHPSGFSPGVLLVVPGGVRPEVIPPKLKGYRWVQRKNKWNNEDGFYDRGEPIYKRNYPIEEIDYGGSYQPVMDKLRKIRDLEDGFME